MFLYEIVVANGRTLNDSLKDQNGSSLIIPDKSNGKINNKLQNYLENNNHATIMIRVLDPIDPLKELPKDYDKLDRETRATLLVQYLTQHADRSQKPIRDFLRKRSQDYEGEPQYFWISNLIHLKNATKILIEDLTQMPEIQEIRLEEYATLID
ncbi:hypothetical protein I4U23_022141 [Adineta vaga]|nr:hypothetical protein I4U23_022141 [Adineta vaga]